MCEMDGKMEKNKEREKRLGGFPVRAINGTAFAQDGPRYLSN